MRTTFFFTGLVAALLGSVNSLKLAGDSAAEVVSTSTANLASQIDAAAFLDADTDRKMKPPKKGGDGSDGEGSDGGYSKSECAAAFKKREQCMGGKQSKCEKLMAKAKACKGGDGSDGGDDDAADRRREKEEERRRAAEKKKEEEEERRREEEKRKEEERRRKA